VTAEDERAAFFGLMERANPVGALLPERIEHIDIDDPVVLAELRLWWPSSTRRVRLYWVQKASSTGSRSLFGGRFYNSFFLEFWRLSTITADIDPAGSPNSSQQMPSPASQGRIWLW
jgi:hypothetical protein